MKLGWDPSSIEVINALGESASEDRARPKFEYMLRQITSGEVGLVVVGSLDRISRNEVDTARFNQACRHNGTLLLAGGALHNLTSETDKFSLALLMEISVYDNRARTRLMMTSRLAKARRGELRVPLPTGLVWASPDEKTYTERLEKAGLTNWLKRLDEHKVKSTHEGRTYYVLPYPDERVFQAAQLRLQWLLETQSMSEVVRRIGSDRRWPVPGKIPVLKGALYNSTLEPEWKNLHVTTTSPRLHKWYQAPAIFGTYEASAPALCRRERSLPESHKLTGEEMAAYHVRVPNAFPSFLDPEQERQIADVLELPVRPSKRGAYTGPRHAALRRLRCGEPVGNGMCNLAMTSVYRVDGAHRYASVGCGRYGHPVATVPGSVDDVVIKALLAKFDTEAIRASIANFRLSVQNATNRRKRLSSELAASEKRVQAATEMVLNAKMNGEIQDVLHWEQERKASTRALHLIHNELQAVTEEENRVRSLSQDDFGRILELGGEIEELIHRARISAPEVVADILRELYSNAYFRRLSPWAYEVEIEFPTGEREIHVGITRGFQANQAALTYVQGRLADGVAPATVAEELSSIQRARGRVMWDYDGVITAPYIPTEVQADPRRTKYEPITRLVETNGVSQDALFRYAMAGRFGPAEYRDGELWLCPLESELHSLFPDVAKRAVVAEMGWKEVDAVRLHEVVAATKQSQHALEMFARAANALAKDAAGGLWVPKSLTTAGIRAALEDAIATQTPKYVDRSVDAWVSLTEAMRQIPNTSHDFITRHGVIVRPTTPGVGPRGRKSAFVLLDSEERARLQERAEHKRGPKRGQP
jgi:hypothetical protein